MRHRRKSGTLWLKFLAAEALCLGAAAILGLTTLKALAARHFECTRAPGICYSLSSSPLSYWTQVIIVSSLSLFFLWLSWRLLRGFIRGTASEA